MSFKLNSTVIKRPKAKEFVIERFRLSKAGRLANGDMTMDIIAKKRKFSFKYEVMSGTDLQAILNELDTSTAFLTLTYEDQSGGDATAIVYAGAIPQEKFRQDGPTYWKNVSFELIER